MLLSSSLKALKDMDTYKSLDLGLDVVYVSHSHNDVQDRVDQPEHIVNVVHVGQVGFLVLPEADAVEIKRVVGEEVQDQ